MNNYKEVTIKSDQFLELIRPNSHSNKYRTHTTYSVHNHRGHYFNGLQITGLSMHEIVYFFPQGTSNT